MQSKQKAPHYGVLFVMDFLKKSGNTYNLKYNLVLIFAFITDSNQDSNTKHFTTFFGYEGPFLNKS